MATSVSVLDSTPKSSYSIETVAILLTAHQLKKTFGARPLFEGVGFAIESGERIGLIGPNGAGKSTLLKIIAGTVDADDGKVSLQRGLRIGYLEQVPQFKKDASVFDTILEGSPHAQGGHASDEEKTQRMAYTLLSKLQLSDRAHEPVSTLSGGWKKRVALARELLKEPDLLLLDEPTNHLDLDSIRWLEEFLSNASFATLTITHDRAFLQAISNRILELDRRNPQGLLSVPGDYATYIETKESMMAAQESREVRLKNTLRRETEWLRQGAKARTTKQQARIHRAGELAEEVGDLTERNRESQVRLDFQSAEKNPKKLLEAKGISKSYGGNVVVPKFDLLLTPQSRLGLLGSNGCGKSTLIRMLVGEEAPDQGEVKRSDQLQPIYFEQNRESLDPEATVLRTLCPTGDFVQFRGNRIHVKSYLDRFLFTGPQMEMRVGKLSGGEQSRLLIARLMLEETNFLILDEPTNDLDLPTLTVLEDVLADFPGAVLLVTHDRFFLDQVVKQIYAFETDEKGQKKIIPFSGLRQWETWKDLQKDTRKMVSTTSGAVAAPTAAATRTSTRKLSYKDQRELDGMETSIHAAETKVAQLTEEVNSPALATQASKLAELTRELSKAQEEVDRLYARWGELEGN